MTVMFCPNCNTPAKGSAHIHCYHCTWLKCAHCRATWDTNTGVWMIDGQSWGTPTTKLTAS